jgi:hypothetical protein
MPLKVMFLLKSSIEPTYRLLMSMGTLNFLPVLDIRTLFILQAKLLKFARLGLEL